MSLNADASLGYVEALPELSEPRPVFDSKRVPGNPAIWVGIYSELTEFALFFVVYFIARAHYPEEFSSGPAKLHTLAGTANTLVLITSSYFVARGIVALRADQPVKAVRWLSATVACGVIYLLIKCGEYLWNQQHGIHTNSSNFFAVYYYTTFNHMLHIFWGGGGIVWAIFRIRSGGFTSANHDGLIAAACYWHMIDLAWILIFPLMYVLR
ncbi:cytochrome c oxidase subunit 3 family protein [Marinobacter salinexigens]|uniref:Cytochrome c oxidase subunit 3 family protein n=1 Tax=Marinobacter salinexigens TaxID=2919747 RepID=A0A5B0VQ27_9GAMM|nr:cytochrome c oxidase subunit 3 family protein [Marinobacter salinexigens]KAA1175959.1 cytochrome c oxidase subunit 3 family protein [Marinobacter salinexigens]